MRNSFFKQTLAHLGNSNWQIPSLNLTSFHFLFDLSPKLIEHDYVLLLKKKSEEVEKYLLHSDSQQIHLSNDLFGISCMYKNSLQNEPICAKMCVENH